MHRLNFGRRFGRIRLLLVGAAALGLCTSAPLASAQDGQTQRDDSIRDQPDIYSATLDDMRVAQLLRQRPSLQVRGRAQDARYYYVQSRDIFGNRGPVYRVLGIAKPKKKRLLADRQKLRAAELLRKAPPAPPTKGPLLLMVSLAKQQVTLYDQDVAVATSPISTGTPNFPTPTGVFSVIQKQWWHRSNLYSSAPMPFMQRLTWSGIALHAGVLPGYPASHGCIRLPDSFAVRLWATTRIGTRTIVTHNEVRPVAFGHPRLFTPKPKSRPDSGDRPLAQLPRLDDRELRIEPPALQGQLAIESVPITASVLDRAAATEGMTFLAGLGTTLNLVNPDGSPIAEAGGVAAAASLNYDDDRSVADRTSRHTISIVRPGRPNEVVEMTEAPQIRASRPNDVLEVAEAPEIREDGVTSITVMRGGLPAEIEVIAVTQVTQASQLVVPAPPIAPAPGPALSASVPEIELAESDDVMSIAATGPIFVANRRRERRPPQDQTTPFARPLRPGPISVFVSRKEQRLFVRKGFEPLFDMPVTIINPERKLGNHVFTAISTNETEARWTVVSLPDERVKSTYRKLADRRSTRIRYRQMYREIVSAPPPVSPREALDRIDMPAEAVTRISELLSAGATLIVSDEGLGHETGRETDFTVVQTQ